MYQAVVYIEGHVSWVGPFRRARYEALADALEKWCGSAPASEATIGPKVKSWYQIERVEAPYCEPVKA